MAAMTRVPSGAPLRGVPPCHQLRVTFWPSVPWHSMSPVSPVSPHQAGRAVANGRVRPVRPFNCPEMSSDRFSVCETGGRQLDGQCFCGS
jgi:hypothetical protein